MNLSGFEVVAAVVEQADRTMQLTVVPKVPVAVCLHCGVCDEVHQTRDLEGVRDLPMADRAVELRVHVSQIWCEPCGRGFTLDETTVTLAPTPKLKAAFPPAINQHGESVWPVALLLVAHGVQSSCALPPEIGAMYGANNTSEAKLAGVAPRRLSFTGVWNTSEIF